MEEGKGNEKGNGKEERNKGGVKEKKDKKIPVLAFMIAAMEEVITMRLTEGVFAAALRSPKFPSIAGSNTSSFTFFT